MPSLPHQVAGLVPPCSHPLAWARASLREMIMSILFPHDRAAPLRPSRRLHLICISRGGCAPLRLAHPPPLTWGSWPRSPQRCRP